MAMLYAQIGDEASARSHLQREQERFPEAQTHVEFLLRNAQAAQSAQSAPAAEAAIAQQLGEQP
jgi:hypothetical protein